MPGRVAAALAGVLVALTSIGCGPPVELPSHEAHRQPAAPTVPIPSELDAPSATTTAAVVATTVPRPIHPAVATRPVTAHVGADPGNPATWDALAQCESGGNWASRTGRYRGGLQFLPSTWRSVGGTGDPADASREEQIRRAQTLQARDGWGAWPACSRRLGYR